MENILKLLLIITFFTISSFFYIKHFLKQDKIYQILVITLDIIIIGVFLYHFFMNNKRFTLITKESKYEEKPAYWSATSKMNFYQKNDENNLELFLRQTSPLMFNNNKDYPYSTKTAQNALHQLTQYDQQ